MLIIYLEDLSFQYVLLQKNAADMYLWKKDEAYNQPENPQISKGGGLISQGILTLDSLPIKGAKSLL